MTLIYERKECVFREKPVLIHWGSENARCLKEIINRNLRGFWLCG